MFLFLPDDSPDYILFAACVKPFLRSFSGRTLRIWTGGQIQAGPAETVSKENGLRDAGNRIGCPEPHSPFAAFFFTAYFSREMSLSGFDFTCSRSKTAPAIADSNDPSVAFSAS